MIDTTTRLYYSMQYVLPNGVLCQFLESQLYGSMLKGIVLVIISFDSAAAKGPK